jgi:predicted metal-binding membrane protein
VTRLDPTSVRAPGSTVVVVVGIAAVAWLALVLGVHGHGAAPDAASHHGPHSPAPAWGGLGLALAGWALMVLAMMLPPALPLVGILAQLTRRRPRGLLALLAGLAAFVGVWFAVGVVLVTGDVVVDRVLGTTVGGTPVRLAGALVLVAGLYQFAPVKQACLTACRSPRWFALRFWRGRAAVPESAALAGAYGVSCVGCCWALMLLGLAVGALALPVMVALTVLMAAERLVPGRVVSVLVPATGVALVAAGLALLIGVVPDALVHPFLGA